MTDTLSREEIDAIRRRSSGITGGLSPKEDLFALLAHIDALTAAAREIVESWDCILPLSYSEQEVVAEKIAALRRSLEAHDA